MFSLEIMEAVAQLPSFASDLASVRQLLVHERLLVSREHLTLMSGRLAHFIECVLASAPDWDPERRKSLCIAAAESAEALALVFEEQATTSQRMRLRASILYEIAEMPAMSSGILGTGDTRGHLGAMLLRRGPFSSLDAGTEFGSKSESQVPGLSLLDIVDVDVSVLAAFQHGHSERPTCRATTVAAKLASHLSVGLTRSEVESLIEVIRIHGERAVRANVSAELFDLIRRFSFPTELFPAQITALKNGLLDTTINSWGFAAPTGTGKTFVARLLILDYLRSNSGGAAIYVVPSRALVHEVTKSLREFFERDGVEVTSISPQITRLTSEEEEQFATKSVVVMTPEKADLLLRLNANVLDRVKLVIVDEVHHLESGTRGALLEFCLWRLRRLAQDSARIVALSAVAPNIADIARWLGSRSQVAKSDARSTRMRSGIFRVKRTGHFREGWIDYADGSSVRLFEKGLATTEHGLLVQLADRMSAAGPVLIVASGKRECEKIAASLVEWKSERGSLRGLNEV